MNRIHTQLITLFFLFNILLFIFSVSLKRGVLIFFKRDTPIQLHLCIACVTEYDWLSYFVSSTIVNLWMIAKLQIDETQSKKKCKVKPSLNNAKHFSNFMMNIFKQYCTFSNGTLIFYIYMINICENAFLKKNMTTNAYIFLKRYHD